MTIYSALKKSGFRSGVHESSQINPLKLSTLITATYVLMLSVYIVLSGEIAAGFSETIETLNLIEIIKGLIYVTVSGVLLFVSTYKVFRVIEKKDTIIISQNKSLIASERLVMAGILSSSVCHDTNNMLNIIKGFSDLLKESENLSPEDQDAVNEIIMASDNLTELNKRMMEAGHEFIPGENCPVDVAEVVHQTLKFAQIHTKVKQCQLQHELCKGLTATINPVLFSRALMNMIINAADATGQKGTVLIRTCRENGTFSIEVHDNGKGIPDSIKEKVFEPFYTSKDDGNGLGLLSLKLYSENNNGTVQLFDSHMGGACFRLTVPVNN